MTDVLERAKDAVLEYWMCSRLYDSYRSYDAMKKVMQMMPELIAEVERLRSVYLAYSRKHDENMLKVIARNKEQRARIKELSDLNEALMENGNDLRTRCQKAEARIKELEADRIEARAQYLLFMNDNPCCIAWNFDEIDETEQDALREQARHMLELEEPWVYVQLREAREQIKRLEAAFLKAEKANLMHHMDADYADENAREALEGIKEGGKDMPS